MNTIHALTHQKSTESHTRHMKVASSLPKLSIRDIFHRKNRSHTAQPTFFNSSTPDIVTEDNNTTQKRQNMGSMIVNIKNQEAFESIALSSHEVGPSQHTAPGKNLTAYKFIKKIGKGGFATVFLVKQRASVGKYYALKAIRKMDVVKMKQERQIMNEKMILRNLKHIFIVELYETFQDEANLYMIMEYVAGNKSIGIGSCKGGDLFRYLRRCVQLPEKDAKFYTAEVLLALEYLHKQKIIYRDLKPENILLDITGHIKLADFGFAKIITNNTASFCGTPDYISPEIVIGIPYTHSVDFWSLGVLIFELVSGQTPFGDTTSEKIYNNIECHNVKWNPLIKDNCKVLVTQLLQTQPALRLSDPETIKNHEWYKTIDWEKLAMRQVTPSYLPLVENPQSVEEKQRDIGEKVDVEFRSNLQLAAPLTEKQQDYMRKCFLGY